MTETAAPRASEDACLPALPPRPLETLAARISALRRLDALADRTLRSGVLETQGDEVGITKLPVLRRALQSLSEVHVAP